MKKKKDYIFDFIGLMIGASITSLYSIHLTKREVKYQLEEAQAEKESEEES